MKDHWRFVAAFLTAAPLTLLTMAPATVRAGIGQPGWNGQASHVDFAVRVSDPATGLATVRARMVVGAAADQRTLVLGFRDLARHPDALSGLVAMLDDEALQVSAGQEGSAHRRTVTLPAAAGTLVIEFTVDPTYYPPGPPSGNPADARSRVTAELGVLRTSSLFPLMTPPADSARVTFDLPEGWIAVTPWESDRGGFRLAPADMAAVDYIGVGPFDVETLTIGASQFRVAAPRRDIGLGAVGVRAILQQESGIAGGPPPGSSGPFSLLAVPAPFMAGGAAGRRSLVQGGSALTLAHEAFHWWTHAALVRPEARWFSEGFTNYYGVRAAAAAGVITDEQARHCFEDLAGEMEFLESAGASSLADASSRYAQDARARRLVYSKGALLALLIDRELAAGGRSLNEVMAAVLSEQRQNLGNDDLRRFFVQMYGAAAGTMLDDFVTRAAALPDLGLGQATGRSGCARYLPGR